MFAFKFRTIRGQRYVDVRLFCGEVNKTLQLAGSMKLDPEEWVALRKVLEAGQDASVDDGVLLHFEDVK